MGFVCVCVEGGGWRVRFCRHGATEWYWRRKFGPQNWGLGWGPRPGSAPAGLINTPTHG